MDLIMAIVNFMVIDLINVRGFMVGSFVIVLGFYSWEVFFDGFMGFYWFLDDNGVVLDFLIGGVINLG